MSTPEDLQARLAAALARLADVERERDTLKAECASISAEFDLPPAIRPAEGEIRRMRKGWKDALAEVERLKAELAQARDEHFKAEAALFVARTDVPRIRSETRLEFAKEVIEACAPALEVLGCSHEHAPYPEIGPTLGEAIIRARDFIRALASTPAPEGKRLLPGKCEGCGREEVREETTAVVGYSAWCQHCARHSLHFGINRAPPREPRGEEGEPCWCDQGLGHSNSAPGCPRNAARPADTKERET